MAGTQHPMNWLGDIFPTACARVSVSHFGQYFRHFHWFVYIKLCLLITEEWPLEMNERLAFVGNEVFLLQHFIVRVFKANLLCS